MKVKEFRIVLPLSVKEYQIGQLHGVMEMCRNETGGGDGIEVLENRPFENYALLNGKYTKGQFTIKKYYIEHKVPRLLRALLPTAAMIHTEESWNAYPYAKTVVTNPDYMKDKFSLSIESLHLPDRGTTENALELPPDLLAIREITYLDIATDPEKNFPPEMNAHLFKSEITGRGSLSGKWWETCEPVMCAYKVVQLNVQRWPPLQTFLEKIGMNAYPKIFTKFHREVFCRIDVWYDLTLDDIRKMEHEVQAELAKRRTEGKPVGSNFS